MSVTKGDMVITPSGGIGLLLGFTPWGRAAVQFVHNGRCTYYGNAELRPATVAEIEASGLAGVGCNQANAS